MSGYSKQQLRNLTGKVRACAREVIYLAERVDAESGEGGATKRALHSTKAMRGELQRIEELKEQIQALVEQGIERHDEEAE